MNNIIKEDIKQIVDVIDNAEALVLGAGSGLSSAAGFKYEGMFFEDNFSDFIEEYGFSDMYSAGFYPFETLEEYWGYWSRHIYLNRYKYKDNELYKNLIDFIKDKNYFVITTNVDHQFQLSGVDKNRLFYTQGDYGLFQCSVPCHNKTYDNEDIIAEMVEKQKDRKIPSNLVPYCPKCNKPMTTNLRINDTFVEDEGWHRAHENYKNFLDINKYKKIVFLELGVGFNTPGIIKYPFENMISKYENAVLIRINQEKSPYFFDIKDKIIFVKGDLKETLNDIFKYKNKKEQL